MYWIGLYSEEYFALVSTPGVQLIRQRDNFRSKVFSSKQYLSFFDELIAVHQFSVKEFDKLVSELEFLPPSLSSQDYDMCVRFMSENPASEFVRLNYPEFYASITEDRKITGGQ
ncbi:MAG: hypothetical protein ACK5VZ_08165 [Alphaproteobacteria bacterium]